MNRLYNADDPVVITKGTHEGKEAKVIMSWDDNNWVLEVLNKDSDITILPLDDFAPLNADNETYIERMLSSFDDYR